MESAKVNIFFATYFFKKHKKVSNKGSKAGGEDSVSG